MITLAGKKVWLVGASAGIGERLAHEIANKGAMLALSARNVQSLDALVHALPTGGHIALPLDVTDDATIEQAWSHMTAGWDVPDMVIYNAGAYDPMGAKAFDLKKIETMMDVNFGGSQRVMARILPAFLTRGTGHIVLVGSVGGYSGLPNALGYGPSKAAMIHFAENLKADLGSTAITVQLVSPGFVKTRLTDKNTFNMPFIMEADEAARRILRGIESGTFETAFPKRLYLTLKFLRIMPYGIYFRLLRLMKIAG